MKIKYVLIVITSFVFASATAQTFKNVRVKQDGLSITVQYDMSGKLYRGDQVALTYSLDNGKTFSVINDAEGDLGSNVLPGKNNEVNWMLIDKDFIIGKIINFRMVTVPVGMVYVDGGQFKRTGIDEKKKEKTEHSIGLRSFLMDATEVTQREYRHVMGKYASDYTGCMECPVENVSWFDAVAYARKVGKRLPTEAEWEYAARGGAKGKVDQTYSGSNKIDDVAWYLANTDSKQPVGRKRPNSIGLYDMSGNVWEWCADWYHDDYFQIADPKNPKGPEYGTEKVVRGGSWFSNDVFCNVSRRYKLKPDYRDTNFGFRCVKDL
jgi:formylglycine-generating enzyme required for sulfatase activity